MRRRWRPVAAGVGAAAIVASVAASAAAQPPRQIHPEVRVDAILARRSALHAGLGVSVPVARAVRLELAAAAGSRVGGGDTGFSGRVDAIGRFLLDPAYESRWGAYAGGGLSVRYDDEADWRGFLAVVIGVEGGGRATRRRGVAPFLEIGCGGVRWSSGVRR